MVSLQTPPTLPNRSKADPELEGLSKKRKWGGDQSNKCISKMENCRDADFLDIQLGGMHFHNTRAHKRTFMDPRTSPEPTGCGSSHMNLDLELNLPCGSVSKKHTADPDGYTVHESSGNLFVDLERHSTKKGSGGLTGSPSWLSMEGGEQEMLTAVCVQCHMLVLLCKSSPTCPNCKFKHPPEQSSPELSKQTFSLFC